MFIKKVFWTSQLHYKSIYSFVKLSLSAILPAILFMQSSCQEKATYMTVTNENEYPLVDYALQVSREKFSFEIEKFLKFQVENNEILTQFKDINNDGEWEYATLLVSIPAKESITIHYSSIEQITKFTPRSQAYIGVSETRDNNFQSVQSHVRPKDHKAQSTPYLYSYEGPGWESDKVAFRTYFDSRNGKDIFGKRTHEMVTHKIEGFKSKYHELQDWGMDILKVGNSLGAGALAMLKNDSLYRLGGTESAEMKIATNGAVFSELSMNYDGWQVDGVNYAFEEHISIYAGQRWYANKIRLSGGVLQDTLVTGIVDLHGLPSKSFTYKGYHVVYTHGLQSYIEDNLGMAVIVPSENFADTSAAPQTGGGVINTHTVYLKPFQEKYQYYFYAGWEKENIDFKEKEKFVEYLKEAIDHIDANVTVVIQ